MDPWPDIPNVQWLIPDVLRNLLRGQMPSTDEFVGYLGKLGPLESVGLLLAGLVLLIWGYQAFRVLVVANGAYFGALGGVYVAVTYVDNKMALFGLIVGGLLLAVLLLPLIRYAVGAAGAALGGFLAFQAWPPIMLYGGWPHLIDQAWIGMVIGMLIGGILFFVTFRVIIMGVTSFEGGVLAVAGVVALLFQAPSVRPTVQDALLEQSFLLPALITVFSVVGFALQHSAAQRKKKAKKLSSSDAGGDSSAGGKGKK